jgi:hypothetical protein
MYELVPSALCFSNTDGFWVALSKFAGCLGVAACSWLIASAVILPAILISRGRIKRRRGQDGNQAYGEFAVLGEEGRTNFSEEIHNGTFRPLVPKSHYVRLGDPGEMQSISSRSRGSSRGNL